MKTMDKLFSEKLEDHVVAPSAAAWDRLEKNLDHRHTGAIAWRWAAVLALVVIGGLYAWMSDAPKSTVAVKNEQPNQPASPTIPTEAKTPAPSQEKHLTQSSPRKSKRVVTPPVKEEAFDQPVVTNPEPESVIVAPSEVMVAAAEVTPKAEKGIVLTYVLAPLEENQPDEALVTAKADGKENSLKRVLDIARNVKNSESPIGELRDMKEELFAFDLKKKSATKKH